MKKIAILFVVFFCSVSLWAQTIEDDATWKLKDRHCTGAKALQGR